MECRFRKLFRYSDSISNCVTMYGKLANYDPTGFYMDTEEMLTDNLL